MTLVKNIGFFLISVFALTSCLKKGSMNIDIEDKTPNILTLQFTPSGGSTINSGLAYFAGGALTYPATEVSHVATYLVSINGSEALSKDLTVSIGADASKAKDNFANDKIAYDIMPDSLFHLESTSATIPVTSRVAPLKITFYPAKVDPTKSYILPVTIKDGGGQTISGNFSTIYFHVIGNPLAGSYNVTGIRYNYTGSIGYTSGPFPANYASTTVSPSPKVAAPNSPTVVSLDFANLGPSGYHYLITYDPAKPTNVDVTGDFLSLVSNFLVLVHTYDPVLKQIHIVSVYNNAAGGAGNDRILDETFTHK